MLAGVAARTSIAKYLEAAGRAREGGAPWVVGGWGHRTAPFHQRQPNHQKAPREASASLLHPPEFAQHFRGVEEVLQ